MLPRLTDGTVSNFGRFAYGWINIQVLVIIEMLTQAEEERNGCNLYVGRVMRTLYESICKIESIFQSHYLGKAI